MLFLATLGSELVGSAVEDRTNRDTAPPVRTAFAVEDTHSSVGIARVRLGVGLLTLNEDGVLVGTYSIRVPLLGSKNDDGRIHLPLDGSFESLKVNGGVIEGLAISDKEGEEPNKIVCKIDVKKQTIDLAITTPERTIHFKSSYSVVEVPKPDSGS